MLDIQLELPALLAWTGPAQRGVHTAATSTPGRLSSLEIMISMARFPMAASTRQANMRSPQPVTYGSRVDAWLVLLLLVAFGAVFYEAVAGPNQLAMAFGAVMVLVMCLCIVPCRYTLAADHLRVRCGLWCWNIPYDEIKSVRETHDPATGPALSLRRLEIRHGRESILVSPKHHAEFVDALYAHMSRHNIARQMAQESRNQP
jgi:membrane protein YdbS with pleckstrin-like domain